jgi:hypothetical protein
MSLVLPDGTRTKSFRKGKIEMVTQVGEETRQLIVHDVEFVPGFKRNLVSYMVLDKKGIRLNYEGDKRYLVSKCGTKLAAVISKGDVLLMRGALSGALANAAMVYNVVHNQEHVSEAVHEDTLYNWHMRFGHQSYDTIEALAAKPGSGIKLTDRERSNCMTCAEDKQTKNKQSKQDSGAHLPIDRIGEFALTSRDRLRRLIATETDIWSIS